MEPRYDTTGDPGDPAELLAWAKNRLPGDEYLRLETQARIIRAALGKAVREASSVDQGKRVERYGQAFANLVHEPQEQDADIDWLLAQADLQGGNLLVWAGPPVYLLCALRTQERGEYLKPVLRTQKSTLQVTRLLQGDVDYARIEDADGATYVGKMPHLWVPPVEVTAVVGGAEAYAHLREQGIEPENARNLVAKDLGLVQRRIPVPGSKARHIRNL